MDNDGDTPAQRDGGVAHLQPCRPERPNSLAPPSFPALRDTVARLVAEGRTRALVISMRTAIAARQGRQAAHLAPLAPVPEG